MIGKPHQCLGIIAARGGSKGLPGKNIIDLCGKSLVEWTIEAAKKAKILSSFLVSTDSEEIAARAKAAGAPVPFMRPPALAQDASLAVDAILHALDYVESTGSRYDSVMLLQPTSPFRAAGDIDGALEFFLSKAADFCISVSLLEHPVEWACRMGAGGELSPVIPDASFARRQDLPDAYRPNGAIFIANVTALRERKTFYGPGAIGYVMPRKRALDIDCMDDLVLAKAVYQAFGDALFDDEA